MCGITVFSAGNNIYSKKKCRSFVHINFTIIFLIQNGYFIIGKCLITFYPSYYKPSELVDTPIYINMQCGLYEKSDTQTTQEQLSMHEVQEMQYNTEPI